MVFEIFYEPKISRYVYITHKPGVYDRFIIRDVGNDIILDDA